METPSDHYFCFQIRSILDRLSVSGCQAEFLKAFLLFPVAHDFLTGFLHNFPVAQAGYCLPVSGCQSDFLTVFLQIPVVQAGFCLWPGCQAGHLTFLNIDKMLRCAIAIKLNGETLRQVRTLYTHNADSHLKITQSVYFTHWYFKTYGQTW